MGTKLTIAAAVSPPVTPAVEAKAEPGATEPRSREAVGRPKNNSASWNDAQDEALKQLVGQHNGRNWKAIATGLDGKTPTQCLHRWQRVLNPNVVKGPWKRWVRPIETASAVLHPSAPLHRTRMHVGAL